MSPHKELPELTVDGVRYATSSDAQAISEITQNLLDEHRDNDPVAYAFYLPPASHADVVEHMATNLEHPDSLFLIRETKGEIHAFMQCVITRHDSAPLTLGGTTIDIPWLATRSGSRSSGHGSALVAGLKQLADGLGADQIRLRVFVFNTRAVEFYQRCGFRAARTEMVARPDSLC